MDRFLLNQVDVKIKLYRASNAFSLMSDGTDYKINIQDIYILVKKVRVNPAVVYGHSKILEKCNALYPYRKVEYRVMGIATGSVSFNWENIFLGYKPDKVIVGFVKSRALNGDITTNPYNFENLDIYQITLSFFLRIK